eukprot:snap_masked-scaffold_4-processed-gene-11.53-mRNA-1 protein AED:1.00 eAED:1.00 QI:0/0/0/0/1/1/2/0/73
MAICEVPTIIYREHVQSFKVHTAFVAKKSFYFIIRVIVEYSGQLCRFIFQYCNKFLTFPTRAADKDIRVFNGP